MGALVCQWIQVAQTPITSENPPVTYWRRRLLAGFAILGMIAPLWAAAGVTLHVFFQHDKPSESDLVSLDALVHGHRHSADIPHHEHPLFAASAPAKTVGPASFGALRGDWTSSEAARRWKISARGIGGLDIASGAGPPSGISPLRI